ncbi:glycosyltransferase family 2 protein [Thiolapillus sp.]|uniref:glycosyltransferase family 2 protein n=1 Tax=Thiolapillus sp. TaxID=2017437 RepID=UPI003AF86B56
MNKFSGVVITYNGEEYLERCLESLFQVCDDVVVVDSHSDDSTVDIARKLGARVIDHDYLGDGPQRSLGVLHCKHDWIINLDQDEILGSDLIERLPQLDLQNPAVEAYECRRKNHLHGKWIKVAGWYPDYICRIFNKNKTDFSQVKTHARIQTARLRRLNEHILHYSFRDLRDMINRLNLYSDWQAETLFNNGKKVSTFTPVIHGMISFAKHYLVKRGVLAGLDGLSISILNALGSYFKYAKLIEKQAQRRHGDTQHK